MNKLKIMGLGIAVVLIVVIPMLRGEDRKLEKKVVTRVTDGDTIVVEGGQRVRLLDIDAQEKGEKCYQKAKERLGELILKKQVNLDCKGEGSFNRRLCYIFFDGTLINSKLVREGLAVAYIYEKDGKYTGAIKRGESEAKRKKKGCEWTNPSGYS